MKKLSILALSALVVFSACKKDDPTPATPVAKVMFVHASLDADSLRVQVNDANFSPSVVLPLLGTSPYTTVAAGSQKLAFVFSTSGNLLAQKTVSLIANNNYSLFATGSSAGRDALFIQDDLTAPSTGKAKVRFVNLSPDNYNLSVKVGTTTLNGNLAYPAASSFQEFTAGSYQITAGDSTKIVSVQNLNGQPLAAGKIYTFIYTGIINGGGTTALKLSVIANN